ncbi:MAG TPA: ATP-binding protein [Azospirillaceae bacterium]|nr:ATP-binding protein [Azospirillaceae bacterium]
MSGEPVIICVDDERVVLDSLIVELRQRIHNCAIEAAENGAEALELIEELLADGCEVPVLVSDYIMPSMKGDELLRRVRELSPATRTVMLTGQASTEGIINAINQASLYRFIAKPWDTEDLVLTVNSAIDSFQKDRALRDLLAELEDRVRVRTAELSLAKERAEATLAELRDAQDQLLQSEKMAALGQLVAGVAHEINTPIGTALTSTTHLAEKTTELAEKFRGSLLRKNDLASFVDTAMEITGLVTSNIQRAAHLVQSFKQVAVDQTSEMRREFELGEYIDEIVLSLSPRVRQTPHSVSYACPPDVMMDSYPGPLAQVLTNFICNALEHAFSHDGETAGHLRITVTAPTGSEAQIEVADDGKGIDPEILPKVFEPFFTTRRNAGNTGLGLHITFNIVTQTLGGTVAVESVPGAGTRFTLRLPRVAPAGEGN